MEKKMPKKVATEGFEKYDPNRFDNHELDNRLNNLASCISKFTSINRTPRELEGELRREDINKVCEKEMMRLKKFINDTQATYESVYAPVTSELVKSIESNSII